ncbi:MAG: hypothetical protein JSV33_14185 [bacterium]|nr:MAG: hypothetical protein JSV33_14185 [bacterium]
MISKRLHSILLVFLPLIIASSLSVSAGEKFEHHALENGVDIRLYRPETILEEMTRRDEAGRLQLILDDGIRYLLIEDTSDPAIANGGDGSFHPMKAELVLQSLAEIEVGYTPMDIKIEIYILPYPRYSFVSSTTCGARIFLSPGVYEIDFFTGSRIVTHEFGHAFQYRYLPDGDEARWSRYLHLRGIDDEPQYVEYGRHMDDPHEIFAEDFRFLFGSEAACYCGTIENESLPLPDQVAGLEEFIVSFVTGEVTSLADKDLPSLRRLISVTNYPNPFNPFTTIRVDLHGSVLTTAHDVDVAVYRADGSLVRRLYRGPMDGGGLTLTWDGRDGRGRATTSGLYLCRVCTPRGSVTGKMMLVR